MAPSSITINGESIDSEDRDRAVDAVWPYDGPHDQHSVVTAAASAGELVRYLNNATQPDRASHTLPYMSTISEVLIGMRSTVMHLDQLFGQLAIAVEEHVRSAGGVYDAEHPDDADAGTERASQLSEQLQQVRRAAVQWEGFRLVGGMAADLDKAASLASGIGNRTDEVPE